jgi:hypothetical protein
MPRAELLPLPDDLLAMLVADDGPRPMAPLTEAPGQDAPESSALPSVLKDISLAPLPAGDSGGIFALDLPPLLANPAQLSGVEPPLSPPAIGEDIFSSVRGALEPGISDLARLGYDPSNQDPFGVNLKASLRRLVRRL